MSHICPPTCIGTMALVFLVISFFILSDSIFKSSPISANTGFAPVSIIALIVMFIMVYLPQQIWEEERKYKEMRRHKMNIISKQGGFDFNDIEIKKDSLLATGAVELIKKTEQVSNHRLYREDVQD